MQDVETTFFPDATAWPDDAALFEKKRLRVLQSFETQDLADDPELAAIVQFAAKLCEVPVALVTMVEEQRQHFIARSGYDETQTARDVSFCSHAMLEDGAMIIDDATDDTRFAENPLVVGDPGLRFYAGQPLVSDEGAPLGALCVVDLEKRPGGLTEFQRDGLAVLGQAVMRRLKARREGLWAEAAIAEREERLRRMIDGVPQIAWSADTEGNFDYFNSRWEELTGAPAPRLALDWAPFIHPDDKEACLEQWYKGFAGNEMFEAEYRIRQKDGSWIWVLSQAVPVSDGSGEQGRWFGTMTDIDELHRALEARDMLAKELSHRIKNIFAAIIGLANLKAARAPEHKPFAADLTDVLQALSRAHEFVRPGSSVVQQSLQGLLAALFAPYRDGNGQPRVVVSGVDAAITARCATPLALVFHELATNSTKYGALSKDGGLVTLTVEDRGEALAINWRETGGPAVIEPAEDAENGGGFGTRLIGLSVTGQLQGNWERHFEAEGLRVDMTIAKKALAS